MLRRQAERDVVVSLPDRRYELAAELLASALESGRDTAASAPGQASADGSDALTGGARALGVILGDEARRRAGPRPSRARLLDAAVAVIGEHGYEPALADDGSLVLRNCPFDALAQRHRTLICGMNLSIMGGMIEGLRARGIGAVLDPQAGRCCVLWEPAAGND